MDDAASAEALTSTPAARPRRQAAFGFIFASSLMNSISFGIMIPILPNLVRQLAGGDTASASEWTFIFGSTWGAMQFVIGPVLGVLSDRVGRRPVLLLSFFGLAVDFLFMAFAPTLWWLYLGRIFNGMTASSFSTAGAYIADITAPERRAKMFGVMTSAFSFGFIIGPVLGGLFGQHDLRLPFLIAAGLTGVNFLYGLLVLPESLPPERRLAHFEWRRANPVGSLKLLQAHPGLTGLVGVGFLFQLAQVVLPTIFVLYTTYRYGWSPRMLGLTFLWTGVLGVIVQMFLVGPAVAKLGERRVVLIGLTLGAIGFVWFGAANAGWVYLVGSPVFAFSGFIMPGLQGLMTRRIPPNHQGQLQGVNQSLQGIASIVGPAIFGETFAWSLRNPAIAHAAPGVAIYIAAALLALALVVATVTARMPSAEPQAA